MSKIEPKFVPVLEVSDICRGSFNGPNGCHCLGGWITEILRGEPDLQGKWDRSIELCNQFHDAVIMECESMGLKVSVVDGRRPPRPCVVDYNDNKRNSRAKLAEAFNRGMRKLGYTQESPR